MIGAADTGVTLQPRPLWQDCAIRLAVALWFGGLAGFVLYRLSIMLTQPLHGLAVASLVSQCCTFLFLATMLGITVLRPRPAARASGWQPRVAALLGTYLIYGLAVLPRADIGIGLLLLSSALVVFGNALALFVLSNLGRSFSIMAEARRLVTEGPYAVVRHPLYLAEQIGILGFFIQVASWEACTIVAAQTYFQLQRVRSEEAVLAEIFPEYAAYAARTARFIPGLW